MDFLNTYTQVNGSDDFAVGIVFGILSIVLLITEIVKCIYEEEVNVPIIFIILGTVLVGVFCFSMAAYSYEASHKEYTYYQVTISDEVTFNEVYEKYEVIKQEGEIFTIREKEIENE